MYPQNAAWEKLTRERWQEFAQDWLFEIRSNKSYEGSKIATDVVYMNFSASAERQWDFIYLTISLSDSDNEFAAIAAGPLGHFLRENGVSSVPFLRELSGVEPSLLRTLTGVRGEKSLKGEVLDFIRNIVEDTNECIDVKIVREAHRKRITSEKRHREELLEMRERRRKKKAAAANLKA